MALKPPTPASVAVFLVAALATGAASRQGAPLDGHYSDGVFGYRADYPFGWKVIYQTYGTGLRVNPPGDETTWIAVLAIEEKTGAPLDKIAAAYEKAVGGQVPTSSTNVFKAVQQLLAEEPADTTKGNTASAEQIQPPQPARRQSVVIDGANGVRQTFDAGHVAVLVLRDQTLYGLQLVAPPASIHAYEPIFDAIVRSFRFQPKLKGSSR